MTFADLAPILLAALVETPPPADGTARRLRPLPGIERLSAR